MVSRSPGTLRRPLASAATSPGPGPGPPGHPAPLHPPGSRHRPRPGRPARGGRDGHRERQEPGLSHPCAGGAAGGSVGHGAVSLPDQGAGPGPAPLRAGPDAGRGRPGGSLAADAGHLRRRHAARPATAAAPVVAPSHHQPRHAPRGAPGPPRGLGALLAGAALRRHRRDARLPGALRLARGQRAAAPASHRPAVGAGAHLHLGLGHHPQPPGDGRGPGGRAGGGGGG